MCQDGSWSSCHQVRLSGPKKTFHKPPPKRMSIPRHHIKIICLNFIVPNSMTLSHQFARRLRNITFYSEQQHDCKYQSPVTRKERETSRWVRIIVLPHQASVMPGNFSKECLTCCYKHPGHVPFPSEFSSWKSDILKVPTWHRHACYCAVSVLTSLSRPKVAVSQQSWNRSFSRVHNRPYL